MSELPGASPPGPHQGSALDPLGGLERSPDPSCVQQWPTVIASCACGETPDPVSGNNWVITKYASQFFKAGYGPAPSLHIYHKSRIFGYVLTNLGLKVVFIFFMVHFIVIVLFNSKSWISLIVIVIFVFDRYLGGRRTATLFLVFSLTFTSRLFRRGFINPKSAWYCAIFCNCIWNNNSSAFSNM